MTDVILTEAESAERLRCSTTKIRALRLSGRLPYMPGRPPKVLEADLERYVEGEKQRAAAKARANAPPSEEEGIAAARLRAYRSWQKRTLRDQIKGR